MCEICHQTFCPEGCPNYEIKRSCAVCDGCHEQLPVGAKIVDINGYTFCEACVDDMNAWDVLELFHVEAFEAEESDDER